MSRLTIIILNFNTKDLTQRAIQSCLDLGFRGLDVVVVDNASTDGSQEELKQVASGESRVRCIFLKENIGFAAGNNVALKEIDSEFAMLLNSDAYFPTNADVESSLDFMDQYQDVGILSPYVKLGNGNIDPACHRGFPTPWNAWSYFLGFEKTGILKTVFGGYHQTWKDLTTIHEIDACTGAAMILRTEAVEEVGLLDEQFFMYGEDLDWCFRFKELEWKIIFFPTLTVIHDKHSSGLKKEKRDKRQGSTTKEAFYDAMKLFYKKHYAHVYPRVVTWITYLGIDFAKHK